MLTDIFLSFISRYILTCLFFAMNSMQNMMNVTDIAPKFKNARLGRIQKISGLLKFGVLMYFVVPLCLVAFNTV